METEEHAASGKGMSAGDNNPDCVAAAYVVDAMPRNDEIDDLPALNDTRRIVRLCMVMDEVRKIVGAYRKHSQGVPHSLDAVRSLISHQEFFICGGAAVEGEMYSFYRQLVLAKRDADAYAQRGIFPVAVAIKKAYKLYEFYPSDHEDIDAIEKARVSTKDATRLKRIAFVLKRFRRCIRTVARDACKDGVTKEERFVGLHRALHALHRSEHSSSVLGIALDKDEFVECGGHRTVSAKLSYSFYRQVVHACRDLRIIMERGRHCKADLKGKKAGDITAISSDEEEEENVDLYDSNKKGPTKSLHDAGIVDEEGEEEGEEESDDKYSGVADDDDIDLDEQLYNL